MLAVDGGNGLRVSCGAISRCDIWQAGAGMRQVLAAQWVLDAVQAYNSLVDFVQTLPLQLPTGEPKHPPASCW